MKGCQEDSGHNRPVIHGQTDGRPLILRGGKEGAESGCHVIDLAEGDAVADKLVMRIGRAVDEIGYLLGIIRHLLLIIHGTEIISAKPKLATTVAIWLHIVNGKDRAGGGANVSPPASLTQAFAENTPHSAPPVCRQDFSGSRRNRNALLTEI